VTKFTLITHPQTQVWGGLITIVGLFFDDVSAAVANFSATNTDKKAAILPTYNAVLGLPGTSLLLFYDGPTPPSGLFDALLAIPYFTQEVGTQSFADLISSFPASNPIEGTRAAFTTISLLSYSVDILTLIQNLTLEWGPRIALLDSATFISFDIEPFDSGLFSHGTPSAYPPDRSRGLLPTNLYFSWEFQTSDSYIISVMKDLANSIKQAAIDEGQDVQDAAIYGNYALSDAPLSSIYGANVGRLSQIRAAVDPGDVMGLTGGFRF